MGIAAKTALVRHDEQQLRVAVEQVDTGEVFIPLAGEPVETEKHVLEADPAYVRRWLRESPYLRRDWPDGLYLQRRK